LRVSDPYKLELEQPANPALGHAVLVQFVEYVVPACGLLRWYTQTAPEELAGLIVISRDFSAGGRTPVVEGFAWICRVPATGPDDT